MLVAVFALRGSNGGGSHGGSGGSTPVTLTGLAGYDPQGTGGEDDSGAKLATDGSLSTSWSTEHYATPAFGNLKSGVGLALDAGRARTPKTITVKTDTPGFTAEILVANSLTGAQPRIDSAARTVGRTAVFPLRGGTGRYFIVWITSLGQSDHADIAEVTAKG